MHTYAVISMLQKRMDEHNANNSNADPTIPVGMHPNGERYTVQPAAIQRRQKEPEHEVVIS
jgi:hypothetical protein